jgi:hypothetical protein
MTSSAATPNTVLAEAAVRLGRQHPPRTPGRRAGAAVYVALTTTRTTGAARRALGFADPVTRAAAATLLDELAREAT